MVEREMDRREYIRLVYEEIRKDVFKDAGWYRPKCYCSVCWEADKMGTYEEWRKLLAEMIRQQTEYLKTLK